MPDAAALIAESAVAREIADAVRAVLTAPDWPADVDAQVQRLTLHLCETLSVHTTVRVPSVQRLRAAQDMRRRNANIVRRFDGRNYLALAETYALSPRQIRRLVDDPRTRRRRGK